MGLAGTNSLASSSAPMFSQTLRANIIPPRQFPLPLLLTPCFLLFLLSRDSSSSRTRSRRRQLLRFEDGLRHDSPVILQLCCWYWSKSLLSRDLKMGCAESTWLGSIKFSESILIGWMSSEMAWVLQTTNYFRKTGGEI